MAAIIILANVSFFASIFTARRHASAVYAVVACLSQVGVLQKWLNVGSRKQHNTVDQIVYFSDAEDLRKTQSEAPPTEAPNAAGVG